MEIIMTEGKPKYASRIKHLRSNYVRFSLDFKPDELEKFKLICEKNNTKPTTEIKKFVRKYCEENE